jgi:ABC-2 type transport system permease protein
LKTSFASFWRRNLGSARLAILSQLEYRLNLAADAAIQPALTALIEVAMWSAIFYGAGRTEIAGFPRESYLAYALWGAFTARITANWMYEFRMIEEIDSGLVNGILVRPVSFYEYYLSQFLGYKLVTSAVSLLVPLTITLLIPGPTQLERCLPAFALVFFYLVLVHTISFTMASFAFFFNRIHSLTVAKNIALWFFTGELFPLDLVPDPYRGWLMNLPFSSAVYVPVGYITGRLGPADLARGFATVAAGLLVMAPIAYWIWSTGRRRYSGTGA